MGKIKKTMSGDQKIKKPSDVLSTTNKSKSRKKKLGAVSLKSQKSLKKHSDSIKSLRKKNKNLSKNQRTNIIQISDFKKSQLKEKDTLVKNKLLDNKKRKSTRDHDESDKLSKRSIKSSKIQKKFTQKIKKTMFKHKIEKSKVKTDLIFNQKAKKMGENDTSMNLDKNSVRSGIKALFNTINEKKRDKTLFEDAVPIFLQFSSIKIGKTPSRTLRIPLKHSLLKDSSEICLITEDIKGYPRKEYEKTIEHYEDVLRDNNITNIKTVMPFYQLKTEYSEFELLRKLVELYDMFIVDAKISSYVVKKLGKIFRDKRKLPIPVRLDANNLKENVKFALRKTSTNLHPHGDNFTIQIAHSEMPENLIYENFEETCKSLAKQFPGGWSNIRGIHVKTPKSLGIPVYYTLKNASEISVPIAKAKRPKAYEEVCGELSTKDDKEVRVHPTGKVTLEKRKKSKHQTKDKKK